MSVASLARESGALGRTSVVVLFGLALMYLLVLDQGHLLSLVQGAAAFDQNLIHEFLHDGRHLIGVPCH